MKFKIGDRVVVFARDCMARVNGVVLNVSPSLRHEEYLVATPFDISWRCLSEENLWDEAKLQYPMQKVLKPSPSLISKHYLPVEHTQDDLDNWKYTYSHPDFGS